MKFLVSLSLILILSGCVYKNKYYSEEQIDVFKTYIENDSIILFYEYPLSHSNHCPGVDYYYSGDSVEVEVKFVRQFIYWISFPMVKRNIVYDEKRKHTYHTVKIPCSSQIKNANNTGDHVIITN